MQWLYTTINRGGPEQGLYLQLSIVYQYLEDATSGSHVIKLWRDVFVPSVIQSTSHNAQKLPAVLHIPPLLSSCLSVMLLLGWIHAIILLEGLHTKSYKRGFTFCNFSLGYKLLFYNND